MYKFFSESKHKRNTIEKCSCILIHTSFSYDRTILKFLIYDLHHCILELWFQSIPAHSKNLNVINHVFDVFFILKIYMQNAHTMRFEKKVHLNILNKILLFIAGDTS